MRRMIALTVACLAGCGTVIPYTDAQLAAKAKEDSTPNLCAITLMAVPPRVLNAAMNEIQARNAQCDWEQAKAITAAYYARQQAAAEAQQAQQANFINALAVSGALLQQSGPRYYGPAPTQTTCVQQGVFLNCNTH